MQLLSLLLLSGLSAAVTWDPITLILGFPSSGMLDALYKGAEIARAKKAPVCLANSRNHKGSKTGLR